MYNPLQTSIVYISPQRKALSLSNGLYRIETIPIGSFVKDNAKSGSEHERIPFQVDLNTLHHWKNTLKAMQFNGVEVPMPLNHTEDPEARRATVVDFEIDKNKDGGESLYTIFKFKDKEAEKALKDTGVSIFVPPKFVDGNGIEYVYPIRHVAFTDYPVIPGLSKMQGYTPIAASYVVESLTKKKKENSKMAKVPVKEDDKEEKSETMEEEKAEGAEGEREEGEATCTIEDFRQIADKLGLEGVPDNKLVQAINHVIDAIMEHAEVDDENELDSEIEESGNEEKGGTGPVAHRVKHEEEHYHPPGGAQPIAAGFISMGRKARLSEINAAAKDGYCTPAVRDDLVKEFCTEEALQLAFTTEGDAVDHFDVTMARIRKNGKVVKLDSEKSQNDALALSYSQVFDNENTNPLLRDAAKRAKAVGQS